MAIDQIPGVKPSIWGRLLGRGGSVLDAKPSLENKGVTLSAVYAASDSVTLTANEEQALACSPFAAAIEVISQSIALLPCKVYKIRPDGAGEADPTNPVDRLLRFKPNNWQTPYLFWRTVARHALVKGNALVHVERNALGDPLAHREVPFEAFDVTYTAEHGRRYVRKVGGEEIPAGDLLHFVGFSEDGIIGIPAHKWVSRQVALASASEEFGARFFVQGTAFDKHVEVPGKLTQADFDQLKTTLHAKFGGVENAHKVPIMQGGQRLVVSNPDLTKLQMLDVRKYQLLEIARIFRIPPALLGDLSFGTYSNNEQQSQMFLQTCLGSWITNFSQEINRIHFDGGTEFYCEFATGAMLRGDLLSRVNALRASCGTAWLTINEVRGIEDLKPLPGGDKLLLPLNMTSGVPVSPDQPKP